MEGTEAKELFTTPAFNPLQMMMLDQLKQQWVDDGKPLPEFWQEMAEKGGQSMVEYWRQFGQNFFGSTTKKEQ